MSNEIPVAFVNSFKSNVFHLAQQKGSRLAGLVRNETQHAEKDFYDYVGVVASQKKIGRHSDVTYTDTPHGRRACFIEDYFHADLVDKEDKLRMIYDPENEYAVAARNAHGRTMDTIILEAALGTSYSGKAGTTGVPLPATQVLACFDGTTTTGVSLNVKTLRAIKKKFNKNEVEGNLVGVISSEEEDSLLGATEIGSEDYNSVKALVNGVVDSFMGFKFVRTELLALATGTSSYVVTSGATGSGTGTSPVGASRCVFFEKSGLILAKAQDMIASIDVLPGKHFAKQVYSSMTLGATRLQEVSVVEVLSKRF